MRGRSSPRDGRRFDHLRSGNSVSPVSPRSAGSQPERWSAGTHDELGGDAAGCGDRAVSGRLYREIIESAAIASQYGAKVIAITPPERRWLNRRIWCYRCWYGKTTISLSPALPVTRCWRWSMCWPPNWRWPTNPVQKANYAVLSWRSTATAAASIGSRWGLTLLAAINLSACSRVRSTACPAR